MNKYSNILINTTPYPRPLSSPINTLTDILNELPFHHRCFLGEVRPHVILDLKYVHNKSLIWSTGGSVSERRGTGCWCITEEKKILISSRIPIDGRNPDSHQAEA